MLAFAAILPLVVELTSGAHARYDVGIRSEVRATRDSFAQNTSVWDLNPRAGLSLDVGGASLEAAYLPRLAIFDFTNARPELLHRADAQVQYAFSSSRRIFLREDAAYGQREFTLLGAGATGEPSTPGNDGELPIDAGQLQRTLPYVQSNTRLGVALALTRLWQLTATAGYDLSGGVGELARTVLPLQWGPHADFSLAYAATTVDTLSTEAYGDDTRFSNGRRASVLVADERWTRKLGRSTSFDVRVGVGAYRMQREEGGPEAAALPAAGVGIGTAGALFDSPAAVRVDLALVPYVDPFTGAAYHRVEGNTAATWRREALSLQLRGFGSYAVSGWERRGQTLVGTELGAGYLFAQSLQLEAGVRGAYQTGAAVFGAPLLWGGYLAVSFAQRGAL